MTQQGDITTKSFVNWINHFAKYKPASLFFVIVDVPKCHLNFDIIKATENNDVLYCSLSNATHESQPLDKAVFQSCTCFSGQEL